jgi:hypothetical protein
MPEHYTKATVMATFWCKKCHKDTLHNVSGGRRGFCLDCMKKLEDAALDRGPEAAEESAPEQPGDLFS